MKACNSKEISSKCNWTRRCYFRSVGQHHFRAPWVVGSCSSPMLNNSVYQNLVITCYQMRPFPSLASKKCKTPKYGENHIFLHLLLVHFVSCMYCKHHGYRAKDQNKGHQAHKCQGKVCMTSKGKCIEYVIWISPEILAEPDCSVRNQKGPKCECITHQEIPHHQLPVANVEWASPPCPQFGLWLNCNCFHFSTFNCYCKNKSFISPATC